MKGNWYYCIGRANGCQSVVKATVIWGTNPYCKGIENCKGALHAGVVTEEGGDFRISKIGNLSVFQGSTNNLIDSSPWTGSYPAVFLTPLRCGLISGDRYFCVGKMKDCKSFSDERKKVYGSGPYKEGSDLCLAALHSGVVPEEGGCFLKLKHQKTTFKGSEKNSVTTEDASYGRAFIICPSKCVMAAHAFYSISMVLILTQLIVINVLAHAIAE
eukprot:TRINITY_DN9124_c0_g1_i1.p1 TRINITY_DN9124_c0_g1~~TRINITY_DN9124_c0_g1_i1.p1  ORF type:complete len:215 (-),score=17.92 TRINITY_DN9124_c0_g1_i1:218-862(-)